MERRYGLVADSLQPGLFFRDEKLNEKQKKEAVSIPAPCFGYFFTPSLALMNPNLSLLDPRSPTHRRRSAGWE